MNGHLEQLTSNHDVTDGDNPWSNNILAVDTEALPNGTFRRRAGAAAKVGATDEVLRELAKEIATVAAGVDVGLGSEGSDQYEPFACRLAAPIRAIDQGVVRAIFGDALYPRCRVSIEPISDGSQFWCSVLADCDGDEALVAHHRRMIAWFNAPGRFVSSAFVAIDPVRPNERFDCDGGCVYPRMLLGVHQNGGIAGLLGVVVYT